MIYHHNPAENQTIVRDIYFLTYWCILIPLRTFSQSSRCRFVKQRLQKVSYAPMLEPKKWSMHRSCLLCTDRVSYAQIVSLMHRQYRNKASYAPTKMTVCPSSRYLCVYAPTFLVGYAPRNENLRKMVFQVHNNHKINL